MSENTTRPGLVMVAVDPAGELATLRAWYEKDKLPAVLTVPGVSAARRWEVIHRYVEGPEGGQIVVPAEPDYVVSYELHDITIAHSEAFLDAIGRDFSLNGEVDGEAVSFEQVWSVTLGQVRDDVNPGAEGAEPGGMLVVSITPERDYVERFHEWYDKEHVGELMSCPGFLRTRRYQALDGIRSFFAMYELDAPEALQSKEFRYFSGRSHDQLPPIHQQVGPHMAHNLCDVYRRLD